MSTRARKNSIVVALNTLGGKAVDMNSLADGRAVVWDAQTDQYLHAEFPAVGVSDWVDIQNKPATVAGFGITDVHTKTDIGDPYMDYVTLFEAEL